MPEPTLAKVIIYIVGINPLVYNPLVFSGGCIRWTSRGAVISPSPDLISSLRRLQEERWNA